MNIWTVFFLVISVVILASPLLLSKNTVSRNGPNSWSGYVGAPEGKPAWEDGGLELDLASGRLTVEDYESMTGRNMMD